ncbi:hypothetical protein SLS56_007749 [Neofusicoccum ribis]|uniref:Uncharacterized protein n=1 Tax=Neofusicoccum ribis TaxID=45134 RepID=A0ABR3SM59_9PEZI
MYHLIRYNQALLERIDGLTGDGHHVFTVNSTWVGPCHWQYVSAADSGDFIDSGAVDVTNRKATPAVTWQPAGSGVACGVQTVTSSLSAGQEVTVTVTATTTTVTTSSDGDSLSTAEAACDGGRQAQTISGGAGIGIGLAIGAVGTGLLTAAAWSCLRRRQSRRPDPPRPAYYTYELNNSIAPLELNLPRRERPGNGAVELPSTPRSK